MSSRKIFNYIRALSISLAFLRASGVCTLLFSPRTKSQRTEKSKEQTIFIIFFALKNPKLRVLNTIICANTSKNKRLQVSGLRPPTCNNKLGNNNFGFNKPICKLDDNKFDNNLINELIMNEKKNDNIW